MLKTNTLKQKLADGQAVLGTWAVIPSPIVVDVICSSGIDFLVVDNEHGPISFETAQNMVITCESRGVTPMLRVGGVIESDILKALDIGAHGIHVPNVGNAAQVEQVIKYCKYPPIGERGFSPFTRAGNYSRYTGAELTKSANENVLTVVHIEGKAAYEELDSIIDIASLDIVYIGLFDLSKSLGIPGEIDDPKVFNYLENAVSKIRSANKHAGTIAVSEEQTRRYVDMGVQYITFMVDCDMLRASYEQIARSFSMLR